MFAGSSTHPRSFLISHIHLHNFSFKHQTPHQTLSSASILLCLRDFRYLHPLPEIHVYKPLKDALRVHQGLQKHVFNLVTCSSGEFTSARLRTDLNLILLALLDF